MCVELYVMLQNGVASALNKYVNKNLFCNFFNFGFKHIRGIILDYMLQTLS